MSDKATRHGGPPDEIQVSLDWWDWTTVIEALRSDGWNQLAEEIETQRNKECAT